MQSGLISARNVKWGGRLPAVGTVVELITRATAGTDGGGSIYCPVVEFTVPSGEKISFTSDFGSLPAMHKIGQSVKIRYDTVDPQKAEIDSAMNIWLVPLILVFMGLLACCLAVAFLGVHALGISPPYPGR